jgi:cell division transport system ATP-binding protein
MSDETIIHLEDVSIFQKNNLVLSGINLDIKKGEFVYLS